MNAPQDPQADADEAKFRQLMRQRFGISVPAPPEAPAPPSSPSPASPTPDLHAGPRISPDPSDDQAVAAYVKCYFPARPAT